MGDVFSRAGGPRKHQEPFKRPEDAPGGPKEAPRKPQETESYVFLRVFLERDRGPRRDQEADSYVFLRVFIESDRGPRRVQ